VNAQDPAGPSDDAGATEPTCWHLSGGAPGTESEILALARGAGAYRFFGPGSDAAPADDALARALAEGVAPIGAGAVGVFAEGLEGACRHSAEGRPLPVASVTVEGDVAIVHVGSGPVEIPAEIARVAIDLRDVPQADGLALALQRAFAAVAMTRVDRLTERHRLCDGLPDEIFGIVASVPTVYGCESADSTPASGGLEGSAASDRPLALLTGPVIARDAASFAVTLRARRRAWLIGEGIPAAAAESDWFGIGRDGMFVRTRTLLADGVKIPDVVVADVVTDGPLREWVEQMPEGAPPPLAGEAKRPDFPARTIPTKLRAATNGAGDGRAALFMAYATVRTFWPYQNGELRLRASLEDRFLEALGILEAEGATKRESVTRALGRFSEVLDDAHVTLRDHAIKPGTRSFAPIGVLPVGKDIVVGRSETNEVSVGEAILAIDGEPIDEAVARMGAIVSCAPHEKASFVSPRLFVGKPSPTVRVRALDGAVRDVTLTPANLPASGGALWERATGMLGELGAPDVFYVTLDASSSSAPSKVGPAVMAEGLAAARAIVLDMRGYPEMASWGVVAKIVAGDAAGPEIAQLEVDPWGKRLGAPERQRLSLWGKGPVTFTGPVVMLVGHETISQAEHLISFFREKKRGKLVGAQTTGANGNITGVQLPGGYGLSFTGMHVAHPDGSPFFGIGHVPDVVVEPTAGDVAAHHDAVLARAIELLAP